MFTWWSSFLTEFGISSGGLTVNHILALITIILCLDFVVGIISLFVGFGKTMSRY